MTVTDPPVVLDRIAQILDDLATCLCSQVITDALPPLCTCGVMPGLQVALDYAGDCDDACGMGWVRLVGSYPSTAPSVRSERPGNCVFGLGLEVEMGVVRCFNVGDGQNPPDPEDLSAAAFLQTSDMLAMYRAVACCRQSKDFVIGTYAPSGPEGGLVGGVLMLSLLVL